MGLLSINDNIWNENLQGFGGKYNNDGSIKIKNNNNNKISTC